MKSAIVVGGGIVGLLSAYLSKDKFDRVVLLERDSVCGGLLNSFSDSQGAWYDYGAHFIRLTGIAPLDEILFDAPKDRGSRWHEFSGGLRWSSSFRGCLNEESHLLDARGLEDKRYRQGLQELLDLKSPPLPSSDLKDYLLSRFGPTFTEHLFRPVISKILGRELSGLSEEVLNIYQLRRILVLTPEESRTLKKNPVYDEKIGFHSHTEGEPDTEYLYPKGVQGLGQWIDMLITKVRDKGVEIITDHHVETIESEAGRVTSATLENGETMECDRLVWTIPLPLAYRAAGLPLNCPIPQFRTTALFHFRFNQAFLEKKSQCLICWDPDMLSWRITFYPNIAREPKRMNQNHLTVEAFFDDRSNEEQIKAQSARVIQELKKMNVIASEAECLEEKIQIFPRAFPIISHDFIKSSQQLNKELTDQLENIILLGKSSSTAFFVNQLLIQAFKKLT